MPAPPPRLVEWMLSPAGDRVYRMVQRRRQRHVLGHGRPTVFIDPRDPHALLMVALLHEYGATDWPVVLVDAGGGLADAGRARRWALADARELARQLRLPVTPQDPPSDKQGARFAAALPDPLDIAGIREPLEALWRGQAEDGGNAAEGRQRLDRGAQVLEQLGHYLGALVLSDGEWYWGVDRLGYLFPDVFARFPATDVPVTNSEPRVELFFSFRSPYSWIALDRLTREAAFADLQVTVRPVLPMVLRGLPVPAAKRLYIARDAAREARRHGAPFGRICDPVPAGGIPAAMARIPDAIEQGVLLRYCHAVARAIWAEGHNIARRRVLDRVIRQADLPALRVAAEPDWRALAAHHREALTALGYWGVPVLCWRELAVWGQDRLGILAARMRADDGAPPGHGGST